MTDEDLQPNLRRATADVAVVMLTLLAVGLGGSTEAWEQGIIWSLAGLLILCSPPQRPVPRWAAFFLGLASLLAFAPLLPAEWGAKVGLREELAALQLPVASTISLQPWLTLEGAVTLLGGGIWALYLVCRRWELPRESILELFAGGVFLMTVAAVVAYLMDFEFALWQVESGRFGFFPHRNQTATLLGMAGVIVLALGGRRLHQHDGRVVVWAAAYLVIAAALVMNYSRAGILIFFFGSLIWLVCSSRFSRNYFALGMGLTGLFVLVSLFVLFGGETWQRFKPRSLSEGGSPVLDFRVLVQKDALSMWSSASWHGLGFGNFEPFFAHHRVESAHELRSAHPDSNWLWLFLEIGPLATVSLFVAVVLLVARCFPFDPNSQRRLRAAAVVAVILFVLHDFIDVSGHVIGTAFTGLLLLALGRHEPLEAPLSRFTPHVFRGLSVLVLALGGYLLVGVYTEAPAPTSGRLAIWKKRLNAAVTAGDLPSAQVAANEALAIAPLDWEVCFLRGKAFLQEGDVEAAVGDFRRARFLERQTWKLPMAIADLWLPRHPQFAINNWVEAMRRSGPDAHDRFQMMVLAADRQPELRDQIWPLIENDTRRLLMFLRTLDGDEFRRYMALWTQQENSKNELPVATLKEIIALWFHRGDRDALEARIAELPQWRTVGAPWLAEIAASKGDHQRAYETAIRSATPPKLPSLRMRGSISQLQLDLSSAKTPDRKTAAGISLYYAYADQDRTDEAIAVLDQLTEMSNCPKFVFYLRAQLHARKRNWPSAWNDWKRFAGEPS